jgi:hypothetical protein
MPLRPHFQTKFLGLARSWEILSTFPPEFSWGGNSVNCASKWTSSKWPCWNDSKQVPPEHLTYNLHPKLSILCRISGNNAITIRDCRWCVGDIFFCHASNLVGFNLNLCIFTYYVYIYTHGHRYAAAISITTMDTAYWIIAELSQSIILLRKVFRSSLAQRWNHWNPPIEQCSFTTRKVRAFPLPGLFVLSTNRQTVEGLKMWRMKMSR